MIQETMSSSDFLKAVKVKKNQNRVKAGGESRAIGMLWQEMVAIEGYQMYMSRVGILNNVSPIAEYHRDSNGELVTAMVSTNDYHEVVVKRGIPDFYGIIRGKTVIFDAKSVSTGLVFRVKDRDQFDQLLRWDAYGAVAGYYVGFYDEGRFYRKVFFPVNMILNSPSIHADYGFEVDEVSGIGFYEKGVQI